MPPPSSDPAAEPAVLRDRLALAEAARADLLAQCMHLAAMVDELQRKVRWLEEQLAAKATPRSG